MANALCTLPPGRMAKYAFLRHWSRWSGCEAPIWDAQRAVVEGGAVMVSNILVVYKKNFEEVHDRSLEEVRSVLDLSLIHISEPTRPY